MMETYFENDWAGPEFLWVQLSEAAASEFDGGRFTAAADGWKKAHGLAQEFGEHDPLLAGSLNNLAIAFRINHDFDEAGRYYRDALEKWESASLWIDRMQLGQRARSSLFHLRMERKHRKKFDDIARSQYHELLPAGHAVTLNNLAELFHSCNRRRDAEQLYRQALRKRLGSMDEDEYRTAIISANLAGLSDLSTKPPCPTFRDNRKAPTTGFISRALQHGWIVDKPAEFTDEGRFMAAIFLTHLVDHNRLNPLKVKAKS